MNRKPIAQQGILFICAAGALLVLNILLLLTLLGRSDLQSAGLHRGQRVSVQYQLADGSTQVVRGSFVRMNDRWIAVLDAQNGSTILIQTDTIFRITGSN